MSDLTIKEMQDFIRAEVQKGTIALLNGLTPKETKRIYKEINVPERKTNRQYRPIEPSGSNTRIEASIFGSVAPGVFAKDPDELCEFDRAVVNAILED